MSQRDVMIVGGSVGAFAAVRALEHALPSGEIRRVGPAPSDPLTVLLWRRGRLALRTLGVDERDLDAASCALRTLRYRDASLAVLSEVDLDGSEARLVAKSEVTRLLGGPGTGPSVTRIERRPRGFVVELDDGSRDATRVLVGAAGGSDPVRAIAFGPSDRVDSTTIVSGRAPVQGWDGWGGGRSVELVVGRDAFIGFLPAQDDSGAWSQMVWWLSLPSPLSVPTPTREVALEVVVGFLRERFAPLVAEIVRTSTGPIRQAPTRSWVHPAMAAGADRIALLGDSLRAATPELGLGVTWALEDAVQLGRAVASRGLVPGVAEYVRTSCTQGESILGRAFATTVVSEQSYALRRVILESGLAPRLAARVLDASR